MMLRSADLLGFQRLKTLPHFKRCANPIFILQEANALYDLRKTHIKSAIKLGLTIHAFKYDFRQFLAKIMKMYSLYQSDFHLDLSETLHGLKPYLEKWHDTKNQEKMVFMESKPRLEAIRKEMENVCTFYDISNNLEH